MNESETLEEHHRRVREHIARKPEERRAWWRRYNENARKRPALPIGCKVVTDYVPRERKLERIVAEVYPAESACQSGWYARTQCGLDLDSGWFTRVDEQSLLF